MSIKEISFFVVEDERPARQALISVLEEDNDINVVGSAGSVQEAWIGILENKVDALFLDIELIGGTAYDLLHKMREQHLEIPPVIIITGHLKFQLAQQALNEFSDCVVKILTKPYWDRWETEFEECKDAIRASIAKKNGRTLKREALFVKVEEVTYRIESDEIDYLEVGGGGTVILVLEDGRTMTVKRTLNHFMNLLPDFIMRIHRQNAINTKKLSHIHHEDRSVHLKGHSRPLSIGEKYYPGLLRMLRD